MDYNTVMYGAPAMIGALVFVGIVLLLLFATGGK